MVELSRTLFKYIPDWIHLMKCSSPYFKRQAYFQMTRFYKGNGWSSYKNAINRYQYFLQGEMVSSKKVRNGKRDINRTRIAAACEEHEYSYQNFVSTLPKLDISLNLSALSSLAMYEPKAFATLVAISKEATPKDNL